MGLGGPLGAPIHLPPARAPTESSAWGSAAMEYAAAFQTIDFSRDPERVDWRAYQHVTLVRPSFWPADLILGLKPANPELQFHRLPAHTPHPLQLLLPLPAHY